ncbi:Peptidyl-glycine alpha-amidating monooxygenase A, partial [Stegodyphus mimosarum]
MFFKMLAEYLLVILSVCITKTRLQRMDGSPFPADSHYSMNINMPDVKPDVPDAYLCTARKLNPNEAYIVKYDPDVNARTAHHMLLFGCKDLQNQNHLYPTYWNCAHGDMCNRMSIMYGWAKNAPAMELPPDVGFLIGGNSSIHYIVLQIHYAKPLPDGTTDNSGLKLHLTSQRQRYITGIRLLLGDNSRIPPHKPKYHIDVNCKFDENYVIHPFAYRVHTHKLGVVVSGYYYNTVNKSWIFLAKGNPQWPQAFYPMQRKHTITNNDILAARCTYNSTEMNVPVKIGSSSTDEMCNLYLMYYTEYRNALSGQSPPCVGVQFRELVQNLPPGNDIPLPRNPEMEQQAFGGGHHHTAITYKNFEKDGFSSPSFNAGFSLSDTSTHYGPKINANGQLNNEYMYKEVYGWPSKDLKFGQIAAVTLDHNGNVAIFHRGDHVWNELTFDYYNNYLPPRDHPIKTPTVIILDSVTGLVMKQWGSGIFYMPHGLFISRDGSFWLTDVALHQVFQFSSTDLEKPALTLGERFVPGNDNRHFCKPASVAVSKSG